MIFHIVSTLKPYNQHFKVPSLYVHLLPAGHPFNPAENIAAHGINHNKGAEDQEPGRNLSISYLSAWFKI